MSILPSSESFHDNVSIQNWNYFHDNVHDLFNDVYIKLEGSVNRHAHPLKKLSPEEVKMKNKPWLSTDNLKSLKLEVRYLLEKRDNSIIKIVSDLIIF